MDTETVAHTKLCAAGKAPDQLGNCLESQHSDLKELRPKIPHQFIPVSIIKFNAKIANIYKNNDRLGTYPHMPIMTILIKSYWVVSSLPPTKKIWIPFLHR